MHLPLTRFPKASAFQLDYFTQISPRKEIVWRFGNSREREGGRVRERQTLCKISRPQFRL
jgi:hypothetical protein